MTVLDRTRLIGRLAFFFSALIKLESILRFYFKYQTQFFVSFDDAIGGARPRSSEADTFPDNPEKIFAESRLNSLDKVLAVYL